MAGLISNDTFVLYDTVSTVVTDSTLSGNGKVDNELGVSNEFANSKLNTSAIQFVATSAEAKAGTAGVIYVVTGTGA